MGLPKIKTFSYRENLVVRVESELMEKIKALKSEHHVNTPEYLRSVIRVAIDDALEKMRALKLAEKAA